ncbi:MAG TPA: serine/threonine-protein kinase, partial [Candidatus Nanopelagicales bacterium]|nr:serine/threonine-protein kinase [Candidatus Nanopelagicales bacterium]
MPIRIGDVVAGKYRVERLLGQGTMGTVVAAMHEQLQRRVAIKVLVEGASGEVVQRFLREARAAVRLKSEHVAQVLDVGELADGSPYMVMEYLEGWDLAQRLERGGAMPVEEAVTYALHACEAMAEAHAAGIIHRDLKPANLFLTMGKGGTPVVKVLDFGISKVPVGTPGEEQGVTLTQADTMLGSPLYMSPEQMRSAKTVDVRADIWSIGAVLYQLLTGRVPFEAESLIELIGKINSEAPAPLRVHRPDIPEGLEGAILRCLRKAREERFGSVGELAQAIAPFAPMDEAARAVPRVLRTLGASSSAPPLTGPQAGGPAPSPQTGGPALLPLPQGATQAGPPAHRGLPVPAAPPAAFPPRPAGFPGSFANDPLAATMPLDVAMQGGATGSPPLPVAPPQPAAAPPRPRSTVVGKVVIVFLVLLVAGTG